MSHKSLRIGAGALALAATLLLATPAPVEAHDFVVPSDTELAGPMEQSIVSRNFFSWLWMALVNFWADAGASPIGDG